MIKKFFSVRNFKSISQDKAKDMLDSGRNVILIDVRPPEEHKELHIHNSISLPLDRLTSEIFDVVEDKSTEILVYCHSGIRAFFACKELVSLGYINVFNMGGINTWKYEKEEG